MTWAEHHQRSEKLAARALVAMQSGQENPAWALYAQAAEEEELALNTLDPSKQRTLGITGVSAVALWYKSQRYREAERLAASLLKMKSMPRFAVDSLQNIIRDIKQKQMPRPEIKQPLISLPKNAVMSR